MANVGHHAGGEEDEEELELLSPNGNAGHDVIGENADGLDRDAQAKAEARRKAKASDVIAKKSGILWRLMMLASGDGWLLAGGAGSLLLSGVADLEIPKYQSLVLAAIVASAASGELDSAAVRAALWGLAAAYAFKALFAGVRIYCSAMTEVRVIGRLQTLLFSAMLDKDVNYHDALGAGALSARLTSDVTLLSSVITSNMNGILQQLVNAAGSLIYMSLLSWQLNVLFLAGVVAFVAVTRVVANSLKALTKAIQAAVGRANASALQALSLMRVVHAFSAEDFHRDLYSRFVQSTLAESGKTKLIYAFFGPTLMLFTAALTLGVYIYGCSAVPAGGAGRGGFVGRMSAADFLAFVLYSGRVQDSLNAVVNEATALISALGAGEAIFDVVDAPAGEAMRDGYTPDAAKAAAAAAGADLRVESVYFAYPSRPKKTVLTGMAFRIAPGQKVALVGLSGGGKSTLIQLLLRLQLPTGGRITLDGHDISLVSRQWLSTQVAVVSQEPPLFDLTVRQNIAYGLAEGAVTESEIRAAADTANAHEFIARLSHGYDTLLGGEGGVQLSGGQKQRLAIARAAVRRPRLLVLDEATSALDSESEKKVQESLGRGAASCLIVAHRLSTVRAADCILVLQAGAVLESGTHAELITRRGVYFRLVRLQLAGGEGDEVATPGESQDGPQ